MVEKTVTKKRNKMLATLNNKKWKIAARLFLSVVLLFLYLPIIWLILFSFTDTTSIANWNGFSLEAYKKLFSGAQSSEIFSALSHTLIIAFVSASLATVLGTMGALGVHYMRRKRLKSLYTSVSQIPMVNADIVTAVSLMLLFSICKTFIRLEGEMLLVNVILAHTSFCAPYVMLNVMPRLANMDNSIYEAALDLGAKPMQAVRKVILPEILPGIIMGFILSVTLSIDDFVVSQFTIEGFNTLSTYIYNKASGKRPLPVEIRALSALMFIVVLGLLMLVNFKNVKMQNKQKAMAKGRKK